MNSPKKRGFTLIELLVAIAIMAILAAILFPVFAQAREKARKAVCISNLKQIAAASQMYLQDYDETFLWNPWPRSDRDRFPYRPPQQADCPPTPRVYFTVLLQPYLRSTEVFTCPSFFGYPLPTYGVYLDRLDKERYRRVGYSFNRLIVGDRCQPWTLASLKSSPSEVALYGDSDVAWGLSEVREVDGTLYWPARANQSWHPSEPRFRGIGWRRHQTGLHLAYVDGHVRFERIMRGGQEIPRLGRGYEERYPGGYFPHAKLE